MCKSVFWISLAMGAASCATVTAQETDRSVDDVSACHPVPADMLQLDCTTDDDCDGDAVCVGSTCYWPLNRYLAVFLPGAVPGTRGWILVELINTDDHQIVSGQWFVQTHEPDDPDAIFRLGCSPEPVDVGRFDGELWITGRAIVPGNLYRVTWIPVVPEPVEPTSLMLPTTPVAGDLVGRFEDGRWTPPDGTVSFRDIVAMWQIMRRHEDAPPYLVGDLAPAEPDGQVTTIDFAVLVRCFQGLCEFSEPMTCN